MYALMKFLPLQRKVVLITREPRQNTIDFKLLIRTIEREHPDYQITVIKHKKLSATYLGKAFREMYHLATARGVLVDGYIIPVSVLNHRPGVKIGQIWHALGAIKKFGHLATGTEEGPHPRVAATLRMHQNYSFVCASGSVPASIYPAAFGLPAERVQPYGMPRVDYLLNDEVRETRRRAIFKAYPQLRERIEAGGRTVLYVPTFRRGKVIPYTQVASAFHRYSAEQQESGPHLQQAKAADGEGVTSMPSLGNDTLVLLPHPQDRSPLPEGPETMVGSKINVLDWLFVADALITDYSAVTYEASLRDIPMVFWPYDLEDYEGARGLALDYYAEVPGPVVTSATEAVEQAMSLGSPDYRAFRSRHLNFVTEADGSLSAEPPHCAKRIVKGLNLD